VTPALWKAVSTLVSACLDLPAEERETLLAEAETQNPEIAQQARILLQAHERDHDFLESPAIVGLTWANKGNGDEIMPDRIGPYRVIAELGHGGMGRVYLALRSDHQFEQEVAVKLIKRGLDTDDILGRFYQERQILARLIHPNIARLLDAGSTEDGRPYFVMERVHGERFDVYCASRLLSLTQRLRLFQQVCDAVRYAHQHLVIHRDIKPGNILVAEDGTPKLLDFGVAKLLAPTEEGATVATVAGFTPKYASPEQISGEPVSTATDVYSLGLLLRELLTNEVTDPLPTDLRSIIGKAINERPQDRYSSAEQLSEDLNRYLRGEAVLARPQTLGYRAWKFVRRHRLAVSAGLAIAFGLMSTTGWALWQTHIARQQHERAERRFNDVRALANSLLFEVHDAIQFLPGATAARKLIVDRALRYLDSLTREASNDLSLQRELAAAYDRVGDVQGQFRQSNLGDITSSLASYRKALALRTAVAAGNPYKAEAQRELFFAHGKLGNALISVGDRSGGMEHERQLITISERLYASDSANVDNRRLLATAYLEYGSLEAQPGNWASGLANCRKAVAMFESLTAAKPNSKLRRRLLALAYSRTGYLLSEYAQNYRESLNLHDKALEILRSILRDGVPDVDIQRLEAWEILLGGGALYSLGDMAPALDRERKALQIFRNLSASDPKDMQLHIDIGKTLGYLGAAYLKIGNGHAAVSACRNSLAELALPKNSSSSDAESLAAMAYSQFHLAEAYALLASKPSLSRNARVDYRTQAQSWYRQSLPTLLEAKKQGISFNETDQMINEAQKEIVRTRY
jgi:eukaryotic-like serine/threonine-protein kinase